MALLKAANIFQIETRFTGVITTLPPNGEIVLGRAKPTTILFWLVQAPCTFLLDQIISADHEIIIKVIVKEINCAIHAQLQGVIKICESDYHITCMTTWLGMRREMADWAQNASEY